MADSDRMMRARRFQGSFLLFPIGRDRAGAVVHVIVNQLVPLDTCRQIVRHGVISHALIGKFRFAAVAGHFDGIEKASQRHLIQIRHVGMPKCLAGPQRPHGIAGFVLEVRDDDDFRVFGNPRIVIDPGR